MLVRLQSNPNWPTTLIIIIIEVFLKLNPNVSPRNLNLLDHVANAIFFSDSILAFANKLVSNLTPTAYIVIKKNKVSKI